MSEISTEHLTREDCEREAAEWQRIARGDHISMNEDWRDRATWMDFQREASANARLYLWAAIEKGRGNG